MMKREIKDAWVTALRSGEFKQGRAVLERNGEFCCLGVLCHLAEKADVVQSGRHVQAGAIYYSAPVDPGLRMDTSISFLPRAVQEWAGLKDSDPKLAVPVKAPNGEWCVSLASLNDHGMDFRHIANIIEGAL